MAKIVPRLSLVARSLSQLSMIMNAPAMKKPEPTRSKIQASGTTKSAFRRMMIDAHAAAQAKARICPTRRTTIGAVRQPRMKPVAQPVPIRPSWPVENPSAAPRSGRSSRCIPFPASRKAVEKSSARTGTIWGQGVSESVLGGCARCRPRKTGPQCRAPLAATDRASAATSASGEWPAFQGFCSAR